MIFVDYKAAAFGWYSVEWNVQEFPVRRKDHVLSPLQLRTYFVPDGIPQGVPSLCDIVNCLTVRIVVQPFATNGRAIVGYQFVNILSVTQVDHAQFVRAFPRQNEGQVTSGLRSWGRRIGLVILAIERELDQNGVVGQCIGDVGCTGAEQPAVLSYLRYGGGKFSFQSIPFLSPLTQQVLMRFDSFPTAPRKTFRKNLSIQIGPLTNFILQCWVTFLKQLLPRNTQGVHPIQLAF